MAFRADREEVERAHWWFIGRRAVLAALTARLPQGAQLELGCGYHGTLAARPDTGLKVGLDIEEEKLASIRKQPGLSAVCASADQLPFSDASFASCLLLDILEHVRDDYLVLSEAFRVLKPGGAALVTAPAFPSLRSAHDDAEMHLRRYRRRDLLRLCEAAGFHVRKSGHFNILLFPAAALWRIISRRLFRARTPRDDFYMLPRPVNQFLAALFAAERHIIPGFPLPFGLSTFAILEKP